MQQGNIVRGIVGVSFQHDNDGGCCQNKQTKHQDTEQ